jgi:hypothetical protein
MMSVTSVMTSTMILSSVFALNPPPGSGQQLVDEQPEHVQKVEEEI